MDHSQQDIDQLISLYLSRQASVGQRQALEEWLASSSENRATFHRLEKIWAMSIPMEYDRKMDSVRDRIWTNASIPVEEPKHTHIDSHRISPFPWTRVAAIFIFFVAGAWLFTEFYKDKETAAPEPVVWLEKVNPSGQRSSHLLPDGTRVWLNVASSLTFPQEFSDTLRQVKLTGEAFFEVAKDAQKPFVVEAEGFNTLVLGTEFNVQAYPEDPEVKVALLEGKVQVQHKDIYQTQTSILSPGEELLAPKDHSEFTKQAFHYESAFGWKEGILLFDGADFQTFRKTIEKWYGVNIEVRGTAPDNWNIRARYQRAALPHVMEDVSFNKNIKFQIEDKTVFITF